MIIIPDDMLGEALDAVARQRPYGVTLTLGVSIPHLIQACLAAAQQPDVYALPPGGVPHHRRPDEHSPGRTICSPVDRPSGGVSYGSHSRPVDRSAAGWAPPASPERQVGER